MQRAGAKNIAIFGNKIEELLACDKTSLQEKIDKSNIIFLAVSETKIAAVVKVLARFRLSGKSVYHHSNLLTAEKLASLRECGAAVAAFSPLQTFPVLQKKNSPFRGACFLFQGDSATKSLAQSIAGSLGSDFIAVDSCDKLPIHAAAVISANLIHALFIISEKYLRGIKSSKLGMEILWPLIATAVANARVHGIANAITGPVARKETEVIEQHRRLLEKDDLNIYDSLSEVISSYLKKMNK